MLLVYAKKLWFKSVFECIYLHITNEQCKKNQSKGCNNNGKHYFSNKSASKKTLSQRTEAMAQVMDISAYADR